MMVMSGTDIQPYSHLPHEGEVLLSPNTRFTVTRGMYIDDQGFKCIDLTEMRGEVLRS